jgi:hypothetical protein
MTTLSFLTNADFVASEAVNITVICFATLAFRRTKFSGFAFLILASFLGIILEAGAEVARYSLLWFGFPFSMWYRIAYLVGMIFWGIGVVQLIRYVWLSLERKSPPNTALEPTATAP